MEAEAGGGSSYISGHSGCKTYSGYLFSDTKMIDGNGYVWTSSKGNYTGMPTWDGSSTMKGNNDNGYCKISLVK